MVLKTFLNNGLAQNNSASEGFPNILKRFVATYRKYLGAGAEGDDYA